MTKTPHISLYWKCQLLGWSAAALYWGYMGFTSPEFIPVLGVLYFISDVVLYILITHLYRHTALHYKWHLLGLKELVKRLIPAILVLGICYLIVTVAKLYLFRLWFSSDYLPPFSDFLQENWLAIFMAGIRLMSIWLLAWHLYHYAQREINITKENARLEIISRDAQLNNLSAQLHPHFLFNSLNNIKALVVENPAAARRAIDLLSDLLRTSLYHNEVMTITVQDELALVHDYLELEQLRLEERLQVNITADKQLAQATIPRLSIQTLVENAIKHGIEKQKKGGLINIQVHSKDDMIIICVQNPGTFNTNTTTTGVGLTNLRERLQLQYKHAARFTIEESANGIVMATIIIPHA